MPSVIYKVSRISTESEVVPQKLLLHTIAKIFEQIRLLTRQITIKERACQKR
jgi:hypothetical protein